MFYEELEENKFKDSQHKGRVNREMEMLITLFDHSQYTHMMNYAVTP